MDGNVEENKKLVGRAGNVRNYVEAISVAKEYNTILKSQNEGILRAEFRRVKLLKEFKE